ncbi:MAG TPA: cytochrome P450 [Gaiellaceae bacterium]|nr:cytochrome P450 [Gaiellaceae bacterium]
MGAPVVRVSVKALRADFEQVFADLARQGDVVWVEAGKQRFLLVNGAEQVHEVLVARSAELVKPRSQAIHTGPPQAELPPSTDVTAFRRALTNGLAARDDAGAAAVRAAVAAETANWGDGSVVELMPLLRRLSIAAAVRGAFASDLDSASQQNFEGVLRWFDNAPRVLPASRFSSYNLRRVQMLAQLESVAAQLLANADRSQPSELDAGDEFVPELLLGAVGPLTQTAGWLLFSFADEPVEAERLRAEWPDLTRTLAFVREVTRLHPTNPRITRAATVDTDVAGERVPAMTRVVLNVNAISRSPRFYDEPDALSPDRWLGTRPDKLAYLAFGIGERRCLGDSFALTTLTALLPALLGRHRLELDTAGTTATGRHQLAEGTRATVSVC